MFGPSVLAKGILYRMLLGIRVFTTKDGHVFPLKGFITSQSC